MYKDWDRKKLEMKNAFKAFFTHIQGVYWSWNSWNSWNTPGIGLTPGKLLENSWNLPLFKNSWNAQKYSWKMAKILEFCDLVLENSLKEI